MERETKEPLWLKLVTTGLVSVAVAAGGAVLLSWRDLGVLDTRLDVLDRHVSANESELTQLQRTFSVIARQVSENSVHRGEHEKSAERWIDQIIKNRDDIDALKNKPMARADPFTGSDGRELQRQIDEINRRVRGGQ